MKQPPAPAKLICQFALVILLLASIGACMTRSRSGNTNRADARSSPAPLHININTASAQELEQLPGVGKVIGERIVAYREQNGRFKRREDVMMVNGISEKKYEEIRSMIVVE
jgi:competence protein ComEA